MSTIPTARASKSWNSRPLRIPVAIPTPQITRNHDSLHRTEIRDESRTNGDTGERVASVSARFGGLFVYQLVDQLKRDFLKRVRPASATPARL